MGTDHDVGIIIKRKNPNDIISKEKRIGRGSYLNAPHTLKTLLRENDEKPLLSELHTNK